MTKKKVELDDIIGLIKTDEPTNSVELKKEVYAVPDKMVEINEELLEDIRHTLVSISGLRAFDKFVSQLGYVEVFDDDIIDLDFKDLINKIDKVL